MTSALPASALSPVTRSGRFFRDAQGRKIRLRGVTYGPFVPGPDGQHFPDGPQIEADLDLLLDLGANCLRTYHPPSPALLRGCERRGLRLLVTLPWSQHIDFLADRRARRAILDSLPAQVAACATSPAVLGFLVGNEIPAQIVRWLGLRRVRNFLETLVALTRRAAPDKLHAYATYPSTEYLQPRNADFLCINLYLEAPDRFDAYLARLHNLAGELPLVLGESGLDTLAHGEPVQSALILHQQDAARLSGASGAFVFAFTDDWHTGGENVTGWSFGLTHRDRSPKPAFHALRQLWGEWIVSEQEIPLAPLPQPYSANSENSENTGNPAPEVSVLVCAYNAAATLDDCLHALRHLRHPSFEVILVDDGSTDATPDIAARFPEVRLIRQPQNLGLSHARNTAARAARAPIVAYTDADCMPDADWLTHLVHTLQSGNFAGAGGPNLAPPAHNWEQACVAAAPGGPAHVLLTDTIAEHIPGCNMAFRRNDLLAVGGFDPLFRVAGDDVDLCWRLQAAGHVIAFSPGAVVWHYRRFTLRAFLQQQAGYGHAEALLRLRHPGQFDPAGRARWRGRLYAPPALGPLLGAPLIYHGPFGTGAFQSLYAAPLDGLPTWPGSPEWIALLLISALFAGFAILPWWPSALMLLLTALHTVHALSEIRLETRRRTIPLRLAVIVLAFLQPLVRAISRMRSWQRIKRPPPGASLPNLLALGLAPKEISFWSETGRDRHFLLESLLRRLRHEGWPHTPDTGWKRWDIQLYPNPWWTLSLLTVTEYHGGPRCLTRLRFSLSPTRLSLLLVAGVILVFGALLWQAVLGQPAAPLLLAAALAAAPPALWLRLQARQILTFAARISSESFTELLKIAN